MSPGGAFSGKDYTKVDRSAAYAARWVAKSLVKAGLAKRCLVQVTSTTKPCFANVCSVYPTSLQVSYAIGVAEPLSVTVFDYGTGSKSSAELNDIVKKNFDLRYNKTIGDNGMTCPFQAWPHCEGLEAEEPHLPADRQLR